MEQKLNSIPPDGAAAQQRYEAELTSSSQTIAKPNVEPTPSVNDLHWFGCTNLQVHLIKMKYYEKKMSTAR